MAGTCDDGAPARALRARRAAVGRPRPLRRDVAVHAASSDVRTPTLVCTARTTSAARSARPSSGTRRCASEACRRGWCSTRAPPPVHPRRPALAPRSTTTAASSTGSSSTPARAAAPRRARRRALAAPARRRSPNGTASRAPRSASCARPTGRDDELRRGAYGVLNKATGVETTDRLGLPDRLDHQGLDGDARHAAGRRGAARPRRAGRRRAARAAARRPRRHQAASPCGTCSPTPAASTATSSPTPAAATTASRSTSRCSAEAAQNHPLGATWSYCNSGFSLPAG